MVDFMVNVGEHNIHGWYGMFKHVSGSFCKKSLNFNQSHSTAELPLHGIHRTCFKDTSIWQSIHSFLCSQIRDLSNATTEQNISWLNLKNTQEFSEDSNIPEQLPQRHNTSLPFLLFPTLSKQVKGTHHP